MSNLPKIALSDDGPLIVEQSPNLTGSDGKAIETKTVAALCRCGASGNKPFCDGSHASMGFKSTADRSRIRNTPLEYAGVANGVPVKIGYTPVLCTHAAECQARAASVFKPKEQPWVQPNDASLTDIVDAVAACPSGALRLSIGDVPAQHLTTGEISVRIEKDGPYHVTNIALDAEFNGVGASRTKYSLCRCGLSKNKPFCDGSHYDEKWSDDAEAHEDRAE